MLSIFDINVIAMTIFNYPISWVELIGVVTGMWCVWLTAKEKISCWPVGIINIVFFFILFYQVQLYSDMVLQIFFLVTSFYGWYAWSKPPVELENNQYELKVSILTMKQWMAILTMIIIFTYALYSVALNIHITCPELFPRPAAAPFRDALCTVMSIFAQLLLTRKKIEAWILWILVDVISCVYYFESGVILVGIEYVIFTFIATKGLLGWRKEFMDYEGGISNR